MVFHFLDFGTLVPQLASLSKFEGRGSFYNLCADFVCQTRSPDTYAGALRQIRMVAPSHACLGRCAKDESSRSVVWSKLVK